MDEPVCSMLVCSTAHITGAEAAKLNSLGVEACPVVCYDKGSVGWIFYIMSDGDAPGVMRLEDPGDEWPGLRAVMRHAWEEGCYWVMLDQDASEVDGLEAWEW